MPRLITLLLIIWGLLVIRIGAPWFSVQESPRVWVPASVRDYHVYGLAETGGMVFRHTAPVKPENFHYYTHHPPLIIWLPYVLSLVMGDNELAVRFGFSAVTLLSAVAFYVLVRRLYGEKVAWWSTAFYGLVPMVAYYGRVPGHDQLGLLAILLFGAVMINWLRHPTKARLIALCLLTWMAVWTAWTAVFFVAALGLAAMWLGSRQHQAAVIGLGVLSIIAFAVMMLFYQSQWDGAIDSLLDAFGWRASNASDDPGTEPFTLIGFVWRTLVHIGVFITPGVSVLAVWGIFTQWRRGTHGTHFANVIVLALLVGSLGYQLVFRNASYVHDYYKLTFVPAMAISAGVAWVYARKQSRIIRPIFDSMLLISIGVSMGLLFWLHSTGTRPELEAAIALVAAETTPDDIIMTSLKGKDIMMPLRFYAAREIAEDTLLENARRTAESTEQRVVYLDCPEWDCELVIIQP